MNCNYCGNSAVLATGKTIYPHIPNLAHLKFWLCSPCGAYVGCHRGTEEPMGLLANGETRKWRQKAHAAFDPIWKRGGISRVIAYSRLAELMGLTKDECHIGRFGVSDCQRLIEVVKRLSQ